jgi:FlaA1/EpsC-like NDP-sugar epimerase
VQRILSRFDTFVRSLAEARVAILVFFHAFVFTASYVLATMARFDFQISDPQYELLFKSSLPVVVAVELLFGMLFGFHRGWWRYVGMSDVIRTALGTTAALGVLMLTWYIDQSLTGISRGVLLINFAFVNIILFGSRVLLRLTHDYARVERNAPDLQRVVIIGAGDAGEALAREIEHRPQLRMKVVGFVDDKAAKIGSHIRGIRIHGPISDIAQIAIDLRAAEALIAMPSAAGPRIREIVHYLSEAGLQFKTVPGLDQLVTGKVAVTQLRAVNIEDLIRREKIDLPGDPVRLLFRGKRVLVTGAGGTIGSELAAQILEFGPTHLALLERSEFALYQCDKRLRFERPGLVDLTSRHLVDIGDERAVATVLNETKPDIVLHAAAHKHVPLGEENPAEYLRNNALATRQLAEACARQGVERFVFISTDKAINPTSVMGATKRVAEIILLDLARTTKMKITAVRFGNVLGSSGSVVPLFLEQIAAGGPVTVTHPDVTRYFLRTSEAISLVLQAATLSEGNRVFMLDMGEPIRIADLARNLIDLMNRGEDIPVVFTGLRPGEKLYEEVRLHGESLHQTEHPQIVVSEAPQPGPGVVSSWLRKAGVQTTSAEEVRDFISLLVPEYETTRRSNLVVSGTPAPAEPTATVPGRMHLSVLDETSPVV